jgi:Holliday junction DNA helicase RuvB
MTTTDTIDDSLITLGGDYPADWDDFVGQEQAKRQLMIACRSAKMRGVPLDHVLLASGIPGIGKTSLALLIAQEMGGNLVVASGSMGFKEARIILSDMEDGDILFYDEFHRAVQGGKGNAEWLLHLLQDGVLVGPLGPEEQPKITVIAATTDAGKLPETIISRFPLKPVLAQYTEDEAAAIAVTLAGRIFPKNMPLPDDETAHKVALAASCNPRAMKGLLVALRDIALVSDEPVFDMPAALDWVGVTADGLTQSCQRYLVCMLVDFQGQAGRAAVQDRMQEPGGLAETERLLSDKGYLGRTAAGRILTKHGIRRARELSRSGVSF